jgi:site-specific DNA-methyltransferase (adenine-specific)
MAFASPEDAELYLLADNKLSEVGGWSQSELGKLLGELAVDDVLLAGWTEEERARFAEEAEAERVGAVDEPEDAIADPPEEPRSRRGEVYELGPHRLMCGDATVVTDLEALMAGGRADLVLTDPPYNVAYVGKTKDALTIENDSRPVSNRARFSTDRLAHRSCLDRTRSGRADPRGRSAPARRRGRGSSRRGRWAHRSSTGRSRSGTAARTRR